MAKQYHFMPHSGKSPWLHDTIASFQAENVSLRTISTAFTNDSDLKTFQVDQASLRQNEGHQSNLQYPSDLRIALDDTDAASQYSTRRVVPDYDRGMHEARSSIDVQSARYPTSAPKLSPYHIFEPLAPDDFQPEIQLETSAGVSSTSDRKVASMEPATAHLEEQTSTSVAFTHFEEPSSPNPNTGLRESPPELTARQFRAWAELTPKSRISIAGIKFGGTLNDRITNDPRENELLDKMDERIHVGL